MRVIAVRTKLSAEIKTAADCRAALVNARVLRILADAWDKYPSETGIPNFDCGRDELQLLEQALRLQAQEGLIRIAGSSVALSEQGHLAMAQACRNDIRLTTFLRTGLLPASPESTSSLLLAIMRAQFQIRAGRSDRG